MEGVRRWWWFDGHKNTRKSPWLQSTIAELDEKTKAMLKLIEEDADSFARRAEMYYKKRPELISMVEDFYRAHRSLAERFDLLKSESGTLRQTHWGSPLSSPRCQPDKPTIKIDKTCNDYSNFDTEDSAESEVEDPEQEDESEVGKDEVTKTKEVREGLQEDNRNLQDPLLHKEDKEDEHGFDKEEVMNLNKELEILREESRIQKCQLLQKDEEKIEVIRQLSLAFELLKDENLALRKCITRKNSPKNRSHFRFW